MKNMSGRMRIIHFIAACAISFTAGARLAGAQDINNMISRPGPYGAPQQEKQYDPTLKIYLTSEKAVYQPGEKPVIDVYLKNDSNETRYFKRVWTTNRDEGVYFQVFTDDRETTGTGLVKKESRPPESPERENALMLDPGGKARIMTLTILTVLEGEHSLRIEYGADYRVAEPQPRNWWSGLAQSNKLTFKATRLLDEEKINEAADSVVEAIHNDIKQLKEKYPSISSYGDGNLEAGTGRYGGISRINYREMRPQFREIKIYFQEPDFQPRTLVLYERPFPYLGTKLFAHIDTGDEARLRSELLDIIKAREKMLHDTTRALASDVRIEVFPFGPDLSKKLRRAAFIVLGEIKNRQIEESKPGEYKIRKWVLDVHLDRVYKGRITSRDIYVKSGALPALFGDEDIIGGKYIMLFAEKNNWQTNYSLIGVEDAREGLIEWLEVKFASKD